MSELAHCSQKVSRTMMADETITQRFVLEGGV